MLKRIDFSRSNFPYWYYQRVGIISSIERLNITLLYGYSFILQRAIIKFQENAPALNLSFEIQGAQGQNTPYLVNLISSPADAGVTWSNAPAPVDNDGFSVNFSANSRKICKELNLPFMFHGNLYCELSGQTVISPVNPQLNTPSYVDIVFEGRYYPEKLLAMHNTGK